MEKATGIFTTMEKNNKIELLVDKIKINGPKLDNSYSVTLEVGEYEQSKISKIMAIQQPTVFKVMIERAEETWKTPTIA